MIYRLFNLARGWGFIFFIGVVAYDLITGWRDSVTLRGLQGFKNWSDHLYGHWTWWEVLLDFWLMVLVVVVFTVAGFVLGSVSRKQGMKLPRWIEKKVPQATSKPDTSDLPSPVTTCTVTGLGGRFCSTSG